MHALLLAPVVVLVLAAAAQASLLAQAPPAPAPVPSPPAESSDGVPLPTLSPYGYQTPSLDEFATPTAAPTEAPAVPEFTADAPRDAGAALIAVATALVGAAAALAWTSGRRLL